MHLGIFQSRVISFAVVCFIWKVRVQRDLEIVFVTKADTAKVPHAADQPEPSRESCEIRERLCLIHERC